MWAIMGACGAIVFRCESGEPPRRGVLGLPQGCASLSLVQAVRPVPWYEYLYRCLLLRAARRTPLRTTHVAVPAYRNRNVGPAPTGTGTGTGGVVF